MLRLFDHVVHEIILAAMDLRHQCVPFLRIENGACHLAADLTFRHVSTLSHKALHGQCRIRAQLLARLRSDSDQAVLLLDFIERTFLPDEIIRIRNGTCQ